MWRRVSSGILTVALLAACSDQRVITEAKAPSIAANKEQADDATGGVNLRAGAVYAMTNQPSGNSIMAWYRAEDGTLTMAGTFPTGGLGAGGTLDPLRSEGSLALAGHAPGADVSEHANHLLFAVNAGSNEISVMRVNRTDLELVSKVPSGGVRPTSITVHQNLLYVLNAGSGTINGFWLGEHGELTPISGAVRTVSGGAAADPSEVAFNNDGSTLVVTDKSVQTIDTYLVGKNGVPSAAHPNASTGPVPFGFAFDNRDNFVVADPNGSASSYRLSRGGSAIPVDGPVQDGGLSPCWTVITENGRFVFVSNAGSRTISSYSLRPDGSLALLQPIAAFTDEGSVPIDLALTSGSRFLYVVNNFSGTIDGYRIDDSGGLTEVARVAGLPPNSQGLAAR